MINIITGVGMIMQILSDIHRKPAFPLSVICGNYADTDTKAKIMLGNYDLDTGKLMSEPNITKNDIIYIPLYSGTKLRDRHICDPHKLVNNISYNYNSNWINNNIKDCKAVLLGNYGPECTATNVWLQDQKQNRKIMSEYSAEFVRKEYEKFGGRLCFGWLDWDIAIDMFYGDGELLKAMNETNSIFIIFCGYHFGIDCEHPNQPTVPHPAQIMLWPTCPVNILNHLSEVKDYLKQGYFITGVHGIPGLKRNNDIKLKELGFKEGCYSEYYE